MDRICTVIRVGCRTLRIDLMILLLFVLLLSDCMRLFGSCIYRAAPHLVARNTTPFCYGACQLMDKIS